MKSIAVLTYFSLLSFLENFEPFVPTASMLIQLKSTSQKLSKFGATHTRLGKLSSEIKTLVPT